MTYRDILKKVDHTLLKQPSTWEQIRELCDDAVKYGTASVCIPPTFVKQAAEYLDGKMPVCTVIGFPNGYNTTAVKVFETKEALKDGAEEIESASGADFIKTSTGFSTAGATKPDVTLMKAHMAAEKKIKAAGGIADFCDAAEFVRLGADRLGTSRLVEQAKKGVDLDAEI